MIEKHTFTVREDDKQAEKDELVSMIQAVKKKVKRFKSKNEIKELKN